MKIRAILSILAYLLIPASLAANNLCAAESGAIPAKKNPQNFFLDNGLTVILKEDRRTPTFAAALFIRGGSAAEGRYAGSGITHFIEHMIFKGTHEKPGLQIEREVKALGGDIGAYTTFDYTAFKMQGVVSNMPRLIGIFKEIVAGPEFDKAEFEKEKKVIKKEMRLNHDTPEKYLSQRLWQRAYLVHPYRSPIIGYEQLFNRLTPEDLKSYYNSHYTADNMVLAVVGDFKAKELKRRIIKIYSSLKRGTSLSSAPLDEPKQMSARYEEIPYAISKSYMLIGFHSVEMTNKDIFALDTLAILLGEGKSSILYKKLHNDENLAYDVGTSNYTPFAPGIFIISAVFNPQDKEKAAAAIYDELQKLKKIPVNKKQLQKAKNQVISSYIFSKQTQEAEADSLGIGYLLSGDMEFSKHYVDGVNSVTPQNIMDAAKKYLAAENMTTVALLPVSEKGAGAESKKSANPVKRKVVKKSLDNGIRLLICEDKALPLVSVRVIMRGGLRSEHKSDNGISNLTAQMLTKGTRSHSEEEIYGIVESLGGSISAYSGNNSFGIYMDLMSPDLKKGIGLLGDILTKPAFSEKKLKALKKDVSAQIMLTYDSIFSVTEKSAREALFEGHPYSMLSKGSLRSVKDLNRKDIAGYYKRYCVGPNIVVSVCGDVRADEVYRWASSSFAGIRSKAAPETEEAVLEKLPGQVKKEQKMDKKQAVVMAGFRSAGINNHDRYPLQILSSLFSGSAGRLYANIRQEKGMAYTLGTFGMTGLDTGTFIFYAATSPENIEKVTDAIIAQINIVCEGGITDEEISSAKNALIAKHLIGMQSAGAFAMQTGLDELYGLGYNNYLEYPRQINNISREELIQTANKYFTPRSCVISVTTPRRQ